MEPETKRRPDFTSKSSKQYRYDKRKGGPVPPFFNALLCRSFG